MDDRWICLLYLELCVPVCVKCVPIFAHAHLFAELFEGELQAERRFFPKSFGMRLLKGRFPQLTATPLPCRRKLTQVSRRRLTSIAHSALLAVQMLHTCPLFLLIFELEPDRAFCDAL